MLDDNESFIAIYNSLVTAHGCTSPSDLAICRSMATLLMADGADPDDDVVRARAANNLASLLPPRKLDPSEKIDRVEIEFVDKDGRAVPAREVGVAVKAENEALRAEIAALKGQRQ